VGGVVGGPIQEAPQTNPQPAEALADAATRLERWARERDWKGTDPYEGMNAARLSALKRSPMGRRVLIQLVKRSPLDLRRPLGIEPRHNPAAIGHALSGYARMRWLDPATRERQVARLVDLLAALRTPGYEEPCWSYPFDVETRVFHYPATTPNTIATAFCGFGLLDVYEEGGPRDALELAAGAGEFFLRHVPPTPARGGAYFGYFPGDRTEIHNASLLAAALLARLARATGRTEFGEAATPAAMYAVEHQREDGSWPYGERADLRWVDNHHTGYVLDSLLSCRGLEERVEPAYDRGLAYYRRNLFLADGTPKFFATRTYPIDSQCVAQAIATFARAGERDARALVLAHRVASFALGRMRRADGAFVFQRGRLWSNRATHMRWTEAPMFDALTLLAQTAEGGGGT
jgi:hypothetical protein